jgi:hypothetical protein
LHHNAGAWLTVQYHCAKWGETVDEKGCEVFFAIDLKQQWSFGVERSLERSTQGWCEESRWVFGFQSVFERLRVDEVLRF